MRPWLTVALCFLFVSSTFAQIEKPVTWDFSSKHLSGDEFEVTFHAKIDNGWYVYSQYLESDDGPFATAFEFESPADLKKIGKNKEISAHKKEGFDEMFDMNVIKFAKDIKFVQKIKVPAGTERVTGYLSFMTCNDSKCLPPTDVDFDIELNKEAADKTVAPEPNKQTTTETKVEDKKTTLVQEFDPKPTKTKEPTKIPTPVPDKPKEKEVPLEEAPKEKTEKKAAAEEEASVEEEASEETEEVEEDAEEASGILEPVKWTYATEKQEDGSYKLIFDAAIDKGWTIYSQYLDPDADGPVATYFELDVDENVEPVGKMEESGDAKEGFDKVFEMDLKKFSNNARFEQIIKVKDEGKPVKGFFGFMTCDDTRCLMPQEFEFEFDLTKGVNVLAKAEEAPVNTTKYDLTGTPFEKYNIDTELMNSSCGELNEEEGKTPWWIFIKGFIGGLLALLTPCVFPMIPLTVSFFTNSSKNKAKGISNAIWYGLSIVIIYVVLGLLVTSIFGPQALNQMAANPWFNLIIFLILVIFGFSFLGYYEITLPSSWSSSTDKMADKGGWIGIFFMALTLVIVSFSCTGLVIGYLLVDTATTGSEALLGFIPAAPFYGMLGFSIALALPFALFAAFPGWLNTLPKSGSWMTSVKVVLGLVELALALKFLSIFDLTMTWPKNISLEGFDKKLEFMLLPYEAFLGLWILIAIILGLYLFGFIRFPHDSKLKKIPIFRAILGVSAFALAFYLCLGFRYNDQAHSFKSLNMLQGLAPPVGHSYIYHVHCPAGLDCYHDYDVAIAAAKAENKPILLDFTGWSCVNCRKMEQNVWPVEKVNKLLNEEYIVVSLYVDESEKVETPYASPVPNSSKIRTVGNHWGTFQTIYFDNNSQPLYVLMTPEGKVLNAPVGYTPDVDEYRDFLQCGLERYESYKKK